MRTGRTASNEELANDRILPVERAKRLLRSRRIGLTSDRQKGLLLKLMAYHRGTVLGSGPEGKRPLPVDQQRFTNERRAAGLRWQYETMADGLAENYDYGVWACLTLPREATGSTYESVETLRCGLKKLHNRFERSSSDRRRPNERPENVVLLEPQADLYAHAHVLYPGRERLMDIDAFRRDWAEVLGADWERANVALTTVRFDDDQWPVERRSDPDGILDDGRREYGNVREYHREPYNWLYEIATMEHSELHDRADALLDDAGTAHDRDLARLGLHFATETRLLTGTPTLIPSIGSSTA